MTDPIRFTFEFSSPYAYVATFRIEALAAAHGRSVDWCVHLLGASMKVTGQTPLLDQPIRGDYAWMDLQRLAREFDAPLVRPEVFPLHPVAAARAFLWLKQNDPDNAAPFARRVFHAYWGEGRDVGLPQAVAQEAAVIGLDRDRLLEGMADPEVKATLRTEVQAAIDRGIFGSPMFEIDGELFWGCDKLGQMDRWLARGGW